MRTMKIKVLGDDYEAAEREVQCVYEEGFLAATLADCSREEVEAGQKTKKQYVVTHIPTGYSIDPYGKFIKKNAKRVIQGMLDLGIDWNFPVVEDASKISHDTVESIRRITRGIA